MVQEMFPDLAKYPHHRFRFSLPHRVEFDESLWMEVMSTQPKELVVRLEDMPGDLARRKFEQARDARSSSSIGLRLVALILIYLLSVPIGIIMIIFALR